MFSKHKSVDRIAYKIDDCIISLFKSSIWRIVDRFFPYRQKVSLLKTVVFPHHQ